MTQKLSMLKNSEVIEEFKKSDLTLTDVVFVIAPRINAAGRMKHGNYAVSLLKETDLKQAKNIIVEMLSDFDK